MKELFDAIDVLKGRCNPDNWEAVLRVQRAAEGIQQELAAAREAMGEAYEYGWRHAAFSAGCNDLIADIGSQEYELDKQSVIATLQRDRQP